MSKKSAILQNAREVLQHAEKLVSFLEKNGYDEPDFTASSPSLPTEREYDNICTPLNQSAQDLLLLVNGPLQWLRLFICSHHDMAAWQTALHFRLFTVVPLDRPMAVRDIAATVKIDEDRLCRIMKLLASQHCFYEVEEGTFTHTAMSALIARDQEVEAVIGFQADEMFEASSLLGDCIEKYPFQSDTKHCAFAMRHGKPLFEWYAERPARASRFAAAMAGYVQMNRDTIELRDRFPWKELEKKIVVDVGGGSGHISTYLAGQFPELEFIVQDNSPDMLAQGPKRPEFETLGGRVTFMKADFFQPQPISGAEAGLYFIRQIVHNYNDADVVRIFRAFVPALEKTDSGSSSPILINDMVLPAANTKPKVEEHALRQIDIAMLSALGAKQRTLSEFQALVKEADPRYEIVRVHGEGIMGLLEVRLQLRSD